MHQEEEQAVGQRKRPPVVDESEADRLARDVFPKIRASKTVCLALKYYALQNRYTYSTFRRKYYKWVEACKSCPNGNGAWAIIDGRSLRTGLVCEEQFFKDVLNAYQRRKTFKAAYDEVLAEYNKLGLHLPCGCSFPNLVRHKERLGEFFKPRDTQKCVSCNELRERLLALLGELIDLQKNCINCNNLI